MNDWNPLQEQRGLASIAIRGTEVRPGCRVTLRPWRSADIMDVALKGKQATVESIEQDFEDRVFLAVTVDDDPGKDFGKDQKPAHRFFFRPDEVEPLDGSEARS